MRPAQLAEQGQHRLVLLEAREAEHLVVQKPPVVAGGVGEVVVVPELLDELAPRERVGAAPEQEVVPDPPAAQEEVPALDALAASIRLHPDRAGDVLEPLRPEPGELEPHVADPLLVVDAADEVPLHLLRALGEGVEPVRADVAVECEREDELERLRLAGGVVAAEQQPPVGELEDLVVVLVEVDDPGPDGHEAVGRAHVSGPARG